VALLEITGLVVHYGKALALDGVDLRVEAGELVAVLGPNGAGKSTLLKAISRAVAASAGRLVFKARAIDGLAVHETVAAGIGHCPEGRHLFPDLTVHKNLILGAYLRRDRAAITADLDRVFTLFPVLRERQRQLAATLSGGEQQMVAIGRALMGRPTLLLLDEPSVGIAPRLKQTLFAAIREIQAAGTAILLVEQDARVAFRVASRVYLLEHGRMVREGQSADLARDDRVRQIYLGV
jgi:branched-chain amino acid transport system ATP-binding protein